MAACEKRRSGLAPKTTQGPGTKTASSIFGMPNHQTPRATALSTLVVWTVAACVQERCGRAGTGLRPASRPPIWLVKNRKSKSCVSINVKLTQASMKFGALAASIFRNRRVSQAAKRRVYLSMVLSTLLFGSHVWVPTAADWRRLENFHHEKVRIMAGVNLFAMRRHRISNSALLRRLRLHPIRAYVGKVCLRWVGKVARMPLHRLPRRLLFAFLNCPRSSQARKTYASAIKEHLRYFDISQEAATWTRLAQNPAEWDRMLDDILLAHHGY